MINNDKAIAYYHSLEPTFFDILDRFSVSQHHWSEDKRNEIVLEIRLRRLENEEEDSRRLRLSFTGVKDLKLNLAGFLLFPHIAVRSIRHYQWERLNYEVEDAENQTFSFVCKTFEASLEEEEGV